MARKPAHKAPVQEASDWQKMATGCAARFLSAKGCTLYWVKGGAWDVEMPDGSWVATENWRELCDLADKLAHPAPPPAQSGALCRGCGANLARQGHACNYESSTAVPS